MNSSRTHRRFAALFRRLSANKHMREPRTAICRLPSAVWLGGLVVMLGLAAQAPAISHAEARGADVKLSYVRGYSNWGPTNVYGTAKVWMGEGVAMLAVHNLPHLLNGDTYGWWLVNTRTGDSVPLGIFNTSEAGDAAKDAIFNQAPPPGADGLVVTIIHPHDPAAAPGPLRTLAGFFPSQAIAGPAQQPATTPARPVAPSKPPHQAQQPPARHHITHPVASGHRTARPLPAHPGRHQSGTAHSQSSHNSQYSAHHIVVLPHTGGGPAARPCALGTRRRHGHHGHSGCVRG